MADRKKKKRTPAQRVEDVLDRAMRCYADYCQANWGSWLNYPRNHLAFFRARQAILRILREVRRG